MDYNIVTLEIADHISHFDYYDRLVSEIGGSSDDQIKIRTKHNEHLAGFYQQGKQLLFLHEVTGKILAKLESMKNKEIHELVEKLEKDAKKMKKLYKELGKK